MNKEGTITVQQDDHPLDDEDGPPLITVHPDDVPQLIALLEQTRQEYYSSLTAGASSDDDDHPNA